MMNEISNQTKGKLNGILPVYKEPGPTSHDIVYRIRRVLKSVDKKIKVGHSGTLDPFADGVLVMGIGKGTRLLDYMKDMPKTYIMEFRLGMVTDTYDITGKLIEDVDISPDPDIFRNTILSFRGAYDQVPPVFSAKKYQGKKLYELARKGEIIKMPPKRISIFDISVLEIKGREARISATVSPGTYMRSLAMDIGYKLGNGATAITLSRIENSGVKISECIRTDGELNINDLLEKIISMKEALSFMPGITLKDEFTTRILNGGQVFCEYISASDEFSKDDDVKIINESGEFLALAKADRTFSFVEKKITANENIRVAKLCKVFK